MVDEVRDERRDLVQVFFSYHREDAEADVWRLKETLESRLGESSVFVDTVGIDPGANWERFVHHELTKSVAVLLVAGPRWSATTSVIYELESALNGGLPIIPLMVRNANWVDLSQELPDHLRARDRACRRRARCT